MKTGTTPLVAAAIIMLCMTGCSRTVEDVARWERKGSTEKLKEALTDPKFEVRKAAAESLGALRAANAVDALAACLNDREEAVQLAAVDSLVSIGTRETITPLIAAFTLENRNARFKAAEALGNMKAVAAIGVLGEALDDPDESIQIAACAAIGEIGSVIGSPPLANKLADESAAMRIKTACIDALARIGGRVALGAMVEGLADNYEPVREKAATTLIRIGKPAIPHLIEGLKNGNPVVRNASIELLNGLDAVTAEGSGLIWYRLARASLSNDPEFRAEVVDLLAAEGERAVPTLIEAASLDVPELREPAAEALEHIGEPALDQVMEASKQVFLPDSREWFKSRTGWIGAPSPLLDLYAAVSILNPDFSVTDDPKTILMPKDTAPERADIPTLIRLLGNERSRLQAVRRLKAAGPAASLPLIAALASPDTGVAEAAASIISERADPRTLQPLMEAVRRRLDAGDPLSQSPLYTALVKLDVPESEALLLKIRPNTERAMSLFAGAYRDVKIIAAETTDTYSESEAPITFRIAYLHDGIPRTMEITFKKDAGGNWLPSPALPNALPKSEQTGQ